MTIESIKTCQTGGVFVMFILDNGEPHEMHMASEADAIAFMNAINGFAS